MQRYDSSWLKKLNGVDSVRFGKENEVLVEIRQNTGEETRAKIFTEAASRQQIITEMEMTETSLEQVFQSLTK